MQGSVGSAEVEGMATQGLRRTGTDGTIVNAEPALLWEAEAGSLFDTGAASLREAAAARVAAHRNKRAGAQALEAAREGALREEHARAERDALHADRFLLPWGRDSDGRHGSGRGCRAKFVRTVSLLLTRLQGPRHRFLGYPGRRDDVVEAHALDAVLGDELRSTLDDPAAAFARVDDHGRDMDAYSAENKEVELLYDREIWFPPKSA